MFYWFRASCTDFSREVQQQGTKQSQQKQTREHLKNWKQSQRRPEADSSKQTDLKGGDREEVQLQNKYLHLSPCTGEIPCVWKFAVVDLLFKGGEGSDPRPTVSPFSLSLAKGLVRLGNHQLTNYLECHILSRCKSSFTISYGCATTSPKVSNDIPSAWLSESPSTHFNTHILFSSVSWNPFSVPFSYFLFLKRFFSFAIPPFKIWILFWICLA